MRSGLLSAVWHDLVAERSWSADASRTNVYAIASLWISLRILGSARLRRCPTRRSSRDGRFDGVAGSYLGQTAARLRELFRYAEAVPCVLVLDGVDALARRRGNRHLEIVACPTSSWTAFSATA